MVSGDALQRWLVLIIIRHSYRVFLNWTQPDLRLTFMPVKLFCMPSDAYVKRAVRRAEIQHSSKLETLLTRHSLQLWALLNSSTQNQFKFR